MDTRYFAGQNSGMTDNGVDGEVGGMTDNGVDGEVWGVFCLC